MKSRSNRLNPAHIAGMIIAFLLILISWWGLSQLDDGLTVRKFSQDGLPLIYIKPNEGENLPGVIVAHGFGGSKQLMLGYGYAIARAGYGVMLLDFRGHGANPNPMAGQRGGLQDDLDSATRALLSQPQVAGDQIALLGHSMGSGAVMQAGIQNPDRFDAVIAISPTGADVSEKVPPNLLLMAGGWEGRFVANAQQLLEEAGGPNQDFLGKRARQFIEIPNAEHISILFRTESQKQALNWLNRTFERLERVDIRDTRILWYGLHIAGWLTLSIAARPLVRSRKEQTKKSTLALRGWLGLILAPFIATALLALLNALAEITNTLDMLVGGSLGLWFLFMGITWLIGGARYTAPKLGNVVRGIFLFTTLWLALGLMAQFTWMNWFLIPTRLWRWPILALLCLPWKLAAGTAYHNASRYGKFAIWGVQSVVLVSGLILTAFLVPGLFVVILMASLLPIILGVETLVGVQYDAPWAYGIGSALLFGWMIAAIFPIT